MRTSDHERQTSYSCQLQDVFTEDPIDNERGQQIMSSTWLGVMTHQMLAYDTVQSSVPTRIQIPHAGFLMVKFCDIKKDQFVIDDPTSDPDRDEFDRLTITDVAVFRRPTHPRGHDTILDKFPRVGIDLRQTITILVP